MEKGVVERVKKNYGKGEYKALKKTGNVSFQKLAWKMRFKPSISQKSPLE